MIENQKRGYYLSMRIKLIISSFFLSIIPLPVFAQDSYPTPFAPLDSNNTVSMEMLQQFTKNPQSIPPEILSIITIRNNRENFWWNTLWIFSKLL